MFSAGSWLLPLPVQLQRSRGTGVCEEAGHSQADRKVQLVSHAALSQLGQEGHWRRQQRYKHPSPEQHHVRAAALKPLKCCDRVQINFGKMEPQKRSANVEPVTPPSGHNWLMNRLKVKTCCSSKFVWWVKESHALKCSGYFPLYLAYLASALLPSVSRVHFFVLCIYFIFYSYIQLIKCLCFVRPCRQLCVVSGERGKVDKYSSVGLDGAMVIWDFKVLVLHSVCLVLLAITISDPLGAM